MCKRHKRFVIFLDVDGVLNTTTTVQKTPDGYTGIDDARVEVLAKTIEKIGGADLVLSSDWKEMKPTDDDYVYLISKLALCGLSIDGQTQDQMYKRGEGILKYLKSHPEIEEYVVLDDCRFDFQRTENSGNICCSPMESKTHNLHRKPRRWRQSCLGII